jgi:hypothetical protein
LENNKNKCIEKNIIVDNEEEALLGTIDFDVFY